MWWLVVMGVRGIIVVVFVLGYLATEHIRYKGMSTMSPC